MMEIKPIQRLEEIAAFIYERNPKLQHHIGFVGTDHAEISDTLLTDFSDFPLSQSVIGAYNEGELVALIAFDIDQQDESVEVWGPYLKQPENVDLAFSLWQEWEKNLPCPVQSYSFFPNKLNETSIEFAKKLGAQIDGEYDVLSIDRASFQPLPKPSAIKAFEERDREAFARLHQEHFPQTYLSVEEILSSISEQHQLFLYKEDKLVKGYVYVEADPQFGESDIHYVAVDARYRGKGIGTHLLRAATTFLFSFEAIQSISLCVSDETKDAIHMYQKAQFTQTYQLISLSL